MSGKRRSSRGMFSRNAVVLAVTATVVLVAFVLQTQFSRIPTWEYVYDTKAADFAYAASKTRDDGILLVGTTKTGNANDALAIKLNSLGRVMWKQQWGGTDSDDSAILAAETPEGQFVLAGNSTKTKQNIAWLTAFGAGGEMLWKTRLSDPAQQHIRAMSIATDGRIFALAGSSESEVPTLLMFSPGGNLEKALPIKGEHTGKLHDLTATNDGHILAAGEHIPHAGQSPNGWLVKLARDGSVVWEKSLGRESAERIIQITGLATDNYACFGARLGDDGKPEKYWIFTLTDDGTIRDHIWFDTGDTGERYRRIHPLRDGSYLLLASVEDKQSGSSGVRVKKLSAAGQIVWSHRYGFGPNENTSNALLAMRDGGVVLVGTREKGGAMGGGAWVLKLDNKGQLFDEQERTGETEVVIEENMQFMGTGKKPKDEKTAGPNEPAP